MDSISVCYDRLGSSKGEIHWVADLTASSALDIAAHGLLWHGDICLESRLSSTIAWVTTIYHAKNAPEVIDSVRLMSMVETVKKKLDS
jgi:hypothetical protein